MKVKLTRPWRNHDTGDVVDVPDHTASGLVAARAATPVRRRPKPAKTKKPAKAEADE